jgi:hypothetical protein
MSTTVSLTQTNLVIDTQILVLGKVEHVMWRKSNFGSHLGSHFGYFGGHFGCIYTHKCFYELVNVNNGFLDPNKPGNRHQNFCFRKGRSRNAEEKTFLVAILEAIFVSLVAILDVFMHKNASMI